jgi:hypothetical protein
MTIEGKVAKILDKHTLVANIGESDGVEEGMHFLIYQPGEQILDPDTDEVLGTAPDVEKAEVVADEIMENMTVMKSDTTTYTRIKDPMNFQVPNIFKKQKETVTKRKDLDTEEPVPEDRSKVKKDDSIRKIEVEAEEEDVGEDEEETG